MAGKREAAGGWGAILYTAFIMGIGLKTLSLFWQRLNGNGAVHV